MKQQSIERFLEAQIGVYEMAYSELEEGRKRSHWMWFIFPQLRGLGASEMARFYGLEDLKEADAYLKHPVLGVRLIDLCKLLIKSGASDARRIFGTPDDLKLRSCISLFASLKESNPVFQLVLDRFFQGQKDPLTMKYLTQS